MLKKLAIGAIASLMLVGSASAMCIGTGSFKTCYDNSGNSYSVNRLGNSTIVNGHNSSTGSSWSQNSTHLGNSTFTNGMDADGNSWSSTTTRTPGGSFTYGSDSDGNAFSVTCGALGCF